MQFPKLKCLYCQHTLQMSDNKTSLSCQACSACYPVRSSVPILLLGEDLKSSLKIADQYGVENHVSFYLPDANHKPLRFLDWIKYVTLVLAELAQYVAAKFWITRRLKKKTQSSVKTKYENKEVNYYQQLNIEKPLLINGSVRMATIGTYRRKLAEYLLSVIDEVGAKKILEAGCGDGLNIALLKNLSLDDNYIFQGFDYSFHRTLLGQRHLDKYHNVRLFNGDIKCIPFERREFDFAFTCHCLEHIPYDTDNAIAELSRVADYVLLIEPIMERQRWMGKIHNYWCDYVTGLEEKAARNGLQVIRVDRLGLGSPFNESIALLCRSTT